MREIAKETSKISRYLLCILIYTLVNISAVAQNTSVTTTGDNSPSIIAEKIAITYGVKQKIVEELTKVYEQAGLTVEARRSKVEDLIKTYKNLPPQGEVLSEEAKQKLGIQHNAAITNILNWDVFLSTKGKNSPAVYALGGYVEIWYGISPEVFKGIYNLLEIKQVAIDEFEKKLKEQIEKYVELEKELAARIDYDEIAKQAKELLVKGDLEGAERILEEDVLLANKQNALKNYEVGKVKELNFKYREAENYFRLATILDTLNPEYAFAYGSNLYSNSFYDKAIESYESSLSLLANDKYVERIACYTAIGLVYDKKNKYDTAINHFFLALKIQEEFNAASYIEIALIYQNLGSTNKHKGDYVKAIEYLQKALDYYYKMPDFTESLDGISKCYNYIGSILISVGSYDDAEDIINEALVIDSILFGPEHPKLVDNYYNLGKINFEKAEYQKTINLFQKMLEILLEIYGENTSVVADIYSMLGQTYSEFKDYKKAFEYHNKALEISLKCNGELHPVTGKIINNLAIDYLKIEDYDKAIHLFLNTLAINLKNFGEVHPEMIGVYNNLGLAFFKKKKYRKSLKFYEYALNLNTRVYQSTHPKNATAYLNIAGVYHARKDYDKAIEANNKALLIALEIYGEEYPLTANIYNNIAGIYADKKELKYSLEYFKKALEIDLKIFGEDNPTIADIYTNLGMVLYKSKRYNESSEYFNKALSIYKEKYPSRHPYIPILQDYINKAVLKNKK